MHKGGLFRRPQMQPVVSVLQIRNGLCGPARHMSGGLPLGPDIENVPKGCEWEMCHRVIG